MGIKQVIVVRKDLNMRKGKIAAQVAHASMKIFLDRMEKPRPRYPASDNEQDTTTHFTPAMIDWLDWQPGKPGFTKIVVSCDSEEEINKIEAAAIAAHIPNAKILDNGLTEFHDVPTITCICLGPDEAEKIDTITGKYPLL